MRLAVLRNSALLSLLGSSSAQSSASTWAQTQPFSVDMSTESLLGSSQQPLTNIVGTNTPSTTALAPAVPITDQFSTTLPTELSTASTGVATSVVTVTSSSASASAASESESASSSSSASAAISRSASASASNSRASSSGTGAATQSTAAAAPVGVSGQQKVMGVAGALAGAAGVLFL